MELPHHIPEGAMLLVVCYDSMPLDLSLVVLGTPAYTQLPSS